MTLATRCDRCGAASGEGVTPGVVFLDGEDITGWGQSIGEGGRRLDLCPECKDDE